MSSNIFSVSSGKQDVESLLDNVAAAINQWEQGEAPSLDLSIMLGEASSTNQQVRQLKRQWNVDESAIIHSTRPGLGPWITRFQRLVRKFTWWYLEPILQQIRVFQRNTAQAIGGLAQNQETQLAHHERLKTEIQALQDRIEVLEAQLEDMDRDD